MECSAISAKYPAGCLVTNIGRLLTGFGQLLVAGLETDP